MPRCTSLSGKNPPVEGGGPRTRRSFAPAVARAAANASGTAKSRNAIARPATANAAKRVRISFSRGSHVYKSTARLGSVECSQAAAELAAVILDSSSVPYAVEHRASSCQADVAQRSSCHANRPSLLAAVRLRLLAVVHGRWQPLPFSQCAAIAAATAAAATAARPDRPDAGGPGGPTTASSPCPRRRTPRGRTSAAGAGCAQGQESAGMPNYSLRVDVPEVTVDVGVLLEKTHQFVPGLKPSNFRVYEDGVEQKVSGFKRVEAPITALMIANLPPTATTSSTTCATRHSRLRSSCGRRITWR